MLLPLFAAAFLVACDKNTPEPDGGDEPEVVTPVEITYLSAVGCYFGSDEAAGISDFQIRLTNRQFADDNAPIKYLYLSVTCNPVDDIGNLAVETGTYTLGTLDAQMPGNFYAGEAVSDGYTGSITVDNPENDVYNVNMVVGGEFTISAEGSVYTLTGTLELDDESLLAISYTGALVVDNYSDEGKPADELDIEKSQLAEDLEFATDDIEYAGCGFYNPLFADREDFEYVFFYLYTSDNYDKYLQIGLLIDRTKYPDELLPAGKYPIMNRRNSEWASMPLSALGACCYMGMYFPVYYGCVYSEDYDSTMSPLVSGEVEILESDLTRANSGFNGSVSFKYDLKDNADTPHTVSGSFSGSVDAL